MQRIHLNATSGVPVFRQVIDQIVFMIEAGELRPVIEQIYPLSETPEAIRRVETAHVRGKLAITVQATVPQPEQVSERQLAQR